MSKNFSTTKVFVAACAGLAFFGVTMLSLGAILPRISHIEGANSLPSIMSIGIILGSIIFGPIVDRFGYKWLLIIGQIILLAGIDGLSRFVDIGLLGGSILFVGLGGGILNGLTNALVADLYSNDKERGWHLSVLGACYCIGALAWSLLCVFIEDYTIPLMITSICMVIAIIYYFIIKFPSPSQAVVVEEEKTSSVQKYIQLIKYPILLFLASILFMQSGFEGITGNFTAKFFTINGINISSATFSLTMFTIGMLAGRMILAPCLKKFNELYVFILYLSVAFVGALIMYIAPGAVATAYISMSLIGFGVGASFPVVLNQIGGRFTKMQGTAFSIAIIIALMGQFLFNFTAGKIFDKGYEEIFPLILLGIIIIMILMVLSLARGKKNVKHLK